jgi:pimeloyl-ACP methyl ester carboxylesterase
MPPATRLAPAAIALVICTSCLASAPPAAAPAAGDWVGGFPDGADWAYLQVHIHDGHANDGARDPRATFDLPLQLLSGRPLKGFGIEGDRVRFEITLHRREWRFDGKVAGEVIEGHVATAAGRVPFRLDRLAKADVAAYSGTYRMDDGRLVHLRPWVELGLEGLLCVDSTSGRLCALFPSSDSTFFCGPSALVTYPAESLVAFETGAPGASVAWTAGGTTTRGRRVALRQEEVAFCSGGVKLAGTLILPEDGTGKPPYPAVVVAPGATAAGNRQMGRQFAEFFACNGVAALIFDKRGTGDSGGDWLKSGFDDLAADVLAGAAILRGRDDVAPERVGLLGFSQGGWVVALAASKSPEVAFIVSQSGPGVTPLEQELYRVEHWLRADGFPAVQVEDAMRLVRRRYECARTGEGWEELAPFEKKARGEPWYPYAGHTTGKADPFWEFWRLIRDFDPVPALENVRCPVLSLYGDKDTYLPVDKSAAIWTAALGRAGNRDVTVRVFPGADHSLLEARTGGIKESALKKSFAPEFFPLLREWVVARAKPQNP